MEFAKCRLKCTREHIEVASTEVDDAKGNAKADFSLRILEEEKTKFHILLKSVGYWCFEIFFPLHHSSPHPNIHLALGYVGPNNDLHTSKFYQL